MTPKTTLVTTLFAFALSAVIGCDDDPQSPGIAERATLLRFENCNDLEKHIEDAVIRQLNMNLDGWNGGGVGFFDRGGVDAAVPSAGAAEAQDDNSGGAPSAQRAPRRSSRSGG